MLLRAFPGTFPSNVGTDHPLATGGRPGMVALGKPRVRPYVTERAAGLVGPPGILSSGRGHVVIAPADVTTGLLATGTWGVVGYDPGYCHALLSNLIFWTLDGHPGRKAAEDNKPDEAGKTTDKTAKAGP
jgi:hypothetical protein